MFMLAASAHGIMELEQTVELPQQHASSPSKRKFEKVTCDKLRCPLTNKIMCNPVIAADGHAYEQEAIQRWLEKHDESPLVEDFQLEQHSLFPALFVKDQVSEFLKHNSHMLAEMYVPSKVVAQLIKLLKGGSLKDLQKLLKENPQVLVAKQLNQYRGNVMHVACHHGTASAVEAIVALVNKQHEGAVDQMLFQLNVGANLPLHFTNNVQVIKYFVQAFGVEKMQEWCRICPPQRLSAYANRINKELRKAAATENLADVLLFLKLGARVNSAWKTTGNTALHSAAFKESIPVVRTLVENRANVNAKNKDGQTPLHFAVDTTSLEIVELLLTSGAKNEADSGGNTPLHDAARSGNLGAVEILANTDTVNEVNNKGKTPLHYAASRGHAQVVEYLLTHDANHKIVDSKERLPIERARNNEIRLLIRDTIYQQKLALRRKVIWLEQEVSVVAELRARIAKLEKEKAEWLNRVAVIPKLRAQSEQIVALQKLIVELHKKSFE